MAEILKEWLTERLQRPISWEADKFGEMMKNGHIIACVLLSYHVINDEKHFLIRSSNARVDMENNWRHLAEWLREIDINLPAVELSNVMEGQGSSLLRLFYQLFLHLDKRDRTNFIKGERKMVSNLVEKMGHRFTVNKLEEEKESLVDDLSRPLLNEKHFIEWQRKKASQVKDTYDYVRHKYSKMLAKIEDSKIPMQFGDSVPKKLSEKEKKDMEKFALRHPCQFKNYTYEQLLDLEEKSLERKKSIIDTDWAKNYMNDLYTKIHKKTESEEFQKQIRNVLSGSLWDLTVAEEESRFDIGLAKKVMKLSQFEKQMCTQIMETKQQARNLVQNRIRGDREFNEQRTQQFNQFLDNVKEQIHLEVVEIDFEKQRQNMLHKKLYAEKMKRKRQHYYEICYETMLSIVDYATKYAYFKRLIEDDVPDHFIHEWKSLYFKHQPIFDILDPMEDILKETPIEEEPEPEEEEIIRLELDRQEALNDSEFKDYHNYSYPWTLDLLIPNYDHESQERKYEYLGTRVLGHAVYTLLDIKYPYPPPRPPADLPDFPVKVLLRGLPDRSIALPMQILLNWRKVFVVRLESAISFCLRKFKTEMIGCTDIELSFDKFVATAQGEEQKELIKKIKAEDEVTSKGSDAYVIAMLGVTSPNTKQTQTPKTIPEDEIRLSIPAGLGQYAYEALNFGASLTDHLLAAMIVELIKEQYDINGFCIVNYPNTYREAQILEETFSGREPPDEGELEDRDDIFLEESIAKHRKHEKDQYNKVRISNLVNDPHKKRIEKPFESYFTCYIHLRETENILEELVIWDLDEENSELIDRFYAVLGINYSMYYEVIDKDFLAQLCKYIIGDYIMPLKSCDRLFGESVLSNLDFPSSDDKRTKTKTVKPEVSNGKSKDRLLRGSKASKSTMSTELEVVKESGSPEEAVDEMVPLLEEIIQEENMSKSFDNAEDIKILAGEEDWDYGEIPIAEIIGVALATCWEEIEKIYIHDMQQLFFAKRLQINCLVPYARFIKDKMEQIITMPSPKQDLVSQFQKKYNDFENDWRDVNLTKNEWHCRVKELQHRLYHICDERKLYAEEQRQALICENWAMEELTTMVNTYISCMQTELNRYVLTIQLLHDFFFAMIKRMPPNDRLSSKDLTKIFKESDETSGSKKGGEDKVYRQLKAAFQDLQLKNIEIDFSNNPFNQVIENNVKFTLKLIKDTNDTYRSLISREYSEIAKIVIPVKKKEETSSDEFMSVEEIFKENALKCIGEWIMGINGEMFRASQRVLAIQYKCYHDMKLFNDHIYKTFMEIQNDINSYYMNEIKSVDRLSKYLQMAVEDARRVPESLVLEHDTFLIDPNLLQFAPPEPPSGAGEISEVASETEFKIVQLARLREQLKIVAPDGIVLQQAFIYIMQDFIFFGKESCEGPLFPEVWRRVDPEQIPKLVILLFGETVYIDWRDFLLYCLNLRFPTVEELLELRKYFRCCDLESTEIISRDDFLNEEFWFDSEFDVEDKYSMLRKMLIKNFIFELYEVSEDKMNYSAFLLAFCKSVNPIEGFVTALSMAVGKKICYVSIDCEEVVCMLIKDKQYKDECLACANRCTEQFIERLLTNVINTCEGVLLTELVYVEPLPDEKKGKKGKGARKMESSHSARTPKSQKSLSSRSKMAQSNTDVKTTFICQPCEEDAVVEEKPVKEEQVEEEQKTEPQADPELAYAVSQTVIWNVLKICLPWHFVLVPEERVTPYVEQVSAVMKRLEVDTDNGDIYVCKFVIDPDICKILHKVKKFTALNLNEEVHKVFF
ncbi:Sperm flagellar protein [Operophtera brumata]|uniref:Sperm flagellar protein n=1 Tax=Operophtera brumata TaxID=104452 RepID=A0A0L7LIG6_OPEBR|nr:Sperm flagellar protein [Operophtera brumata]